MLNILDDNYYYPRITYTPDTTTDPVQPLVDIAGSCGVMFQNEFVILGGNKYTTQVNITIF